ncbi:MAG TPA: hypothetical protein VFV34_21775 [Blastocatellia bacterium]|nr:hypothetical protein [Blastocatellia bacterium]
MGVEYQHYLIPRPNSFAPSAVQIGGLIHQLIADNWLWVPETAISGEVTQRVPRERGGPERRPIPLPITINWLIEQLTRDQFLLLEWNARNIVNLGIKYPFLTIPVAAEEVYYSLALHWSGDYIYHTSEIIEPFDETRCRCGTDLGFDAQNDVFYESRLRSACPSCGRPFDPSDLTAVSRHPWTGEPLPPVAGGATYRFAVVLDCGKCIPECDGNITLDPAFKESCEMAVSCPLYEVGDFS